MSALHNTDFLLHPELPPGFERVEFCHHQASSTARGGQTRALRRALCLLVAVLSTSQTAWAQRDPEVIVEVDRQQVYLGEAVIYNVTVNHVENPTTPSLDGFDAFTVESVGQQSLDSQQITIINGQRSEIIRRGRLFQYRLTPRAAGTITIPSPTSTVNGTVITGRQISLTVIAPEQQDVVIPKAAVDRTSVYPLQPFTVTLKLYVQQLPGELSSRSPLSVQPRQPVRLTVPWLDDENIADGLQPQQSWREILEPLAGRSNRQGVDGMQINGIGSQSAFSFFSESRRAVFLPKSKIVKRSTSDGAEKTYHEYELSRTFQAERPGVYVFSPCSIKGMFATEFDGQNLNGDDIYAVSDSISVTVKAVPLDGRPDSYIGGIGSFSIAADVVPRTAHVGDPITLSVTIYGQGTVTDLHAPNIASIPNIDANFRLYESTEKTVDNGKVFTWSLRPLRDTVTEFPAIPVSYFDVKSERYVSTASEPIPLQIASAQHLATSEIVATQTPDTTRFQDTIELNDAGLFANHSNLRMLRASGNRLSEWMPVWGCMLTGFALVSLGIRRKQRLQADPSIRRRQVACSRADKALSQITAETDNAGHPSPDALGKVVIGLIADFTNRDESGMTSADILESLTQIGVAEPSRQRTRQFLDQCDAARYGDRTASSDSLLSECRMLVNDLGQEMTQRC